MTMIVDLFFPLSPGLLLILGGLLVPFLSYAIGRVYVLVLPAVLLVYLFALPDGNHGAVTMLGYELELLRLDNLSRIFATIFLIASILGNLYAWHEPDRVQRTAAQIYAGSAVAAALSGDLISLFVFWELTAVSSVFLIWVFVGCLIWGGYNDAIRRLMNLEGYGSAWDPPIPGTVKTAVLVVGLAVALQALSNLIADWNKAPEHHSADDIDEHEIENIRKTLEGDK